MLLIKQQFNFFRVAFKVTLSYYVIRSDVICHNGNGVQ